MNDQALPALQAYWRFFEGFNSRRPEAWADGLNFPHARISHNGRPRVIPSVAEHVRDMNWSQVEASGWDHSVGMEPALVHAAPDCVHIVGGWSRFTRDEALIMRNHVSYVITRMQIAGRDHWGMQARFGVDPGPEGLSDVSVPAASLALARCLDAVRVRDAEAIAGNTHRPLLQILPGRIDTAEAPAEVIRLLQDADLQDLPQDELRAVQAGPKAVNFSIGHSITRGRRALAMMIERDGRWGLQALSIIS